jgi:hypothetical protein
MGNHRKTLPKSSPKSKKNIKSIEISRNGTRVPTCSKDCFEPKRALDLGAAFISSVSFVDTGRSIDPTCREAFVVLFLTRSLQDGARNGCIDLLPSSMHHVAQGTGIFEKQLRPFVSREGNAN